MPERTVFQSNSQKRVIRLGPQASVRDAAGVMTRANCGSVLIMEPPDVLLGILTERDLMTRVLAKGLDPEATTVRAVMTSHPVCVPPEMRVADAVLIMIERGFRHLPIVGPAPGRVLAAVARQALRQRLDHQREAEALVPVLGAAHQLQRAARLAVLQHGRVGVLRMGGQVGQLDLGLFFKPFCVLSPVPKCFIAMKFISITGFGCLRC